MESTIHVFLSYLRVEKGLAQNTILAYGRDLRRFAEFLRKRHKLRMEDVTREDIVDFLSNLYKEKLDSRSVARFLVSLRGLFKFAFVHPDDQSLETIARTAAERRGECVDIEFRMRAADGRWVWLRKRADVVEDEETGAASLVGIAFDVTERKREAELSATADQRLRDAIEAISEAFVLWDSGNRLVLCNSKSQSLRELAREAVAATGGARRRPIAHLRSAPRRRTLASGQ